MADKKFVAKNGIIVQGGRVTINTGGSLPPISCVNKPAPIANLNVSFLNNKVPEDFMPAKTNIDIQRVGPYNSTSIPFSYSGLTVTFSNFEVFMDGRYFEPRPMTVTLPSSYTNKTVYFYATLDSSRNLKIDVRLDNIPSTREYLYFGWVTTNSTTINNANFETGTYIFDLKVTSTDADTLDHLHGQDYVNLAMAMAVALG